ncbi:MAG: hypothetical protein BWY83_00171 [bacterium ADurb.Bin478]|nr:MAG: hypothetical protein BWY83_00171 [bacterium ADurb.Bin478]
MRFQRLQLQGQTVILVVRQRDLQHLELFRQFLVALRLGHLSFQRAYVLLHLGHDVLDADQILFGGFQFTKRGFPAHFVFGDAGGLFENFPPFILFAVQNTLHLRQLDDRIGVRPGAGVEKQIQNILQPAGISVDQILTFTGAKQPAGDQNLAVIDGQDVLGVLDFERHLGHAHRLGRRRTIKNNVFHAIAAQRSRALLTHHPADGIDNIALAATIGTDDTGDAVMKKEIGLFCKRLKADDCEFRKVHEWF